MIETIALVLTGLSLSASIIYYSTVLKNSEKTRRAQLVSKMREIVWNIESGHVGMELLNARAAKVFLADDTEGHVFEFVQRLE